MAWPDDSFPEWAHHEAGHAVAMLVLDTPFASVVVSDAERRVRRPDPHPDFLDTDFSAPDNLAEARRLSWHGPARAHIGLTLRTFAAGPIAQMDFEGEDPPADERRFYLFGGADDVAWIRDYALGLAAYEIEDDRAVSALQRQIISNAVVDSVALVVSHRERIASVAGGLLDRGELSHAEVRVLAGLL